MRWRWAAVAAKLLFAFFGFSALVTEVAVLVERHRFAAGDFFSYFTVESNLLACLSLVLSALALTGGSQNRVLDFYRGAVTLCMATTIAIFIVLLSGYSSAELTAVPWDNTVLHYIMPIVIIVDWLVAGQPVVLPFPVALSWLGLPLAYLVYSLVRGAIVDWYPYPFMDASLHGYGALLVTSVVLAVVLAAFTVVIASVPRVRPRVLGTTRPAGG